MKTVKGFPMGTVKGLPMETVKGFPMETIKGFTIIRVRPIEAELAARIDEWIRLSSNE